MKLLMIFLVFIMAGCVHSDPERYGRKVNLSQEQLNGLGHYDSWVLENGDVVTLAKPSVLEESDLAERLHKEAYEDNKHK